jgi:hypothetical protein
MQPRIELLAALARVRVAMIPRMTEMIAACRTCVAFAGFFSNDPVGAVGKALKFDCSESPVGHHAAEDTSKSNKGFSHVFPRFLWHPRPLLLLDHEAIRRVGL